MIIFTLKHKNTLGIRFRFVRMSGVFCVQGSIRIGDGEIAGGGTEGNFTRGVCLAIMARGARKPIGDEVIVRGAALQS